MTHSLAINSTITKETAAIKARAGSSKSESIQSKEMLVIDDEITVFCGKYQRDEVLTDEEGNCSSCGSDVNEYGECLYVKPFQEEYKGITIYECKKRNIFYTAPIWPDYLFFSESLKGLKLKIDNLK